MSVAVVIPYGGECEHRKRAWGSLRERYGTHHPDWQLVEAEAPRGPWSKGAAVNPAVESCDADVLILADADVWTDGLPEAVAQVEAGAPWAIPHTLVHRLSEVGTAAALDGADWREQPIDQAPYRGIPGGGVVVAPREVIHSIPLDVRFTGWG